MKLRFSLRTVLILMAFVGASLMCVNVVRNIYYTAERHRLALQVVDGMPFLHDGFVHMEKGKWINAPPFPTRWEEFARARIHPLAYVKMSKMYVTGNWAGKRGTLKELKNLNGLHELSANIDSFNEEDALRINEVPALRECIFCTQGPAEPGAMAIVASNLGLKQFIMHPTDLETCAAISRNHALTEVGVGGIGFNREKMQLVFSSPSIERLILINTEVDTEMLETIGRMTQLKKLELADVPIEPETIAKLSRMRLTSIVIDKRTAELNSPVAKLSESTSLKSIQIRSPFQREEGDIKRFAMSTQLEELLLTECVIDAESLRVLSDDPTLKAAAFTGDLADELAQAFVDTVPGRTLIIYGNGIRRSHEKPNGKREFTSTTKAAKGT